MSRQTGNSLLGSLRGKIWVSSSVLAFFICTFGLISYLVVSLLVNDPFYGIFIPFLLLAFTVMLFGWWLANEVVTPVENVTMLAQSMERSTSTSIPKTSGSAETDELLKTIQRNNQQYQKLAVAMDHVANGNLEVKPLQGNDRLSSAFQKLLTRVGESIHAKEELDDTKEALRSLRMEVSGVRSGNLDVALKGDYPQTKELTTTFQYLVDNLRQLITMVQNETSTADEATKKVEKELEELVERDENRVLELNEASVVLKQVPGLINKISEDLRGSAKSARTSIEKAKQGNDIASKNSAAVGSLRKQIREDIKRLESLTERSHDIERVAKTVEDLANRTNMIALNASIQATELGEGGHGFVLVAEEVERLATRANGTNKQISTLNKSILAEIKKVENSIEASMSEVASLSKYAIESGTVIGELERYVGQFLNLQENLIAYSNDQSEETDEAFSTYSDTITETEATVSRLKSSCGELGNVTKSFKELKARVSEFRLPEAPVEEEHSEEPSYFDAPQEDATPEADEFNTEAFNAVRMNTDEFNAMDIALADDSEPEITKEEFATGLSGQDAYLEQLTSIEEEPVESVEIVEQESQTLVETTDYPTDEPLENQELGLEFDSESVEMDTFDSTELAADEIDADAFDSGEFALESFSIPESSQEIPETHEIEVESQDSDDGVFDLYKASLSAPPDEPDTDPEDDLRESVFDSGEYKQDELIEASSELAPLEIDASETTQIDADEIADLLGGGDFESAPQRRQEDPAAL